MGKFRVPADGSRYWYLRGSYPIKENTAECDPMKARQQGGSLKNSGDSGLFSEKWWSWK